MIANEKYPQQDFVDKHNIELVDFDTLLTRSNFISLHCPLLPETKEGLELDAREEALNDAYAAIVGRYETIKAMPSGEASGLVGQIQGLRVAAGIIVEIPAVVE